MPKWSSFFSITYYEKTRHLNEHERKFILFLILNENDPLIVF
jgi:hypothetical protein